MAASPAKPSKPAAPEDIQRAEGMLASNGGVLDRAMASLGAITDVGRRERLRNALLHVAEAATAKQGSRKGGFPAAPAPRAASKPQQPSPSASRGKLGRGAQAARPQRRF